jgi:hypothetical protein
MATSTRLKPDFTNPSARIPTQLWALIVGVIVGGSLLVVTNVYSSTSPASPPGGPRPCCIIGLVSPDKFLGNSSSIGCVPNDTCYSITIAASNPGLPPTNTTFRIEDVNGYVVSWPGSGVTLERKNVSLGDFVIANQTWVDCSSPNQIISTADTLILDSGQGSVRDLPGYRLVMIVSDSSGISATAVQLD